MASINDSERLDVLLALALAFDTSETEANRSSAALASLSALSSSDIKVLERRAKWHARLAPDEGARWLARTLSRAHQSTRNRLARIDEYVHPSHFIEALRAEPAPVQSLVLRHLPPASIEFVAAALGIAPPTKERDDDANDYYQRERNHRGNIARQALQNPPNGSPDNGADATVNSSTADSSNVGSSRLSTESLIEPAPHPDVVEVVRQEFLSRFVAAAALRAPKNLDLLSGAQIARLVRLLGVRETAIACRGEAALESVAAFLRRFSPEDARLIAAHIKALTLIEPARIRFAERLVHSAMSAENTPQAMLDQIGMSVLAFSLSERDAASRRYTAQKLPVEAAKELAAIIEDSKTINTIERKTIRALLDETEALAANLRRPPAQATA